MADNTPVVVKAYRTPQGKEDGVYSEVRSEDLSIPLINKMLDETGLEGEDVDDLIWGCAQQRGEQGNNMARVISLLSDLGESVPATTVNRWCASSAQAIISAADAIRAGQRDVLIAGGVESMSRVEMGENTANVHPALNDDYNVMNLQMGMTAEKVAEEYDISRETQDEYAARSQQRAVEATEDGRFDDEIVPIEGTDDEGNEITVEKDEGIRPGTTKEKLEGLPTVFKADGTVTPGNSSQISDGAAATMITSKEFAEEQGLDILAEIGGNNVAGVDPTVMGIGPIPAVEGLCERTGRDPEDYDLVELNEAFASQCYYCQQELGFDDDIYNVNGGAIAIGHPLGASGARLPVTLIHEMNKRDAELGLATECVGFGQGAAIEFELP
ncbi:acetyl-CoA C-acetyltransferase/acetyl-CoA acyltransferase [Halorientalis persicus]|uniref:Acetyl-CoA C-acetyltransferase/acetyl-CoA acyltransferase n=1 Tax=Halorientalis persicus TaxID=1367881 RepID=A0A1H8H6M9_9EURY|nr:thiolase family protein [Halorientalis persicus]SEN51785.1 acetyl-CoA C-acetyltransferase/acetyl-CoA acyltransferase [Halorientalis persicus]